MADFILNKQSVKTDLADGLVLLDFLRKEKQLIGTRAACGAGDCGSCMVLSGEFKQDRMYYRPVNSCLLPLGLVNGQHIVTIEGINTVSLNPIQQALIEQGAIQCGFCTPGLVMAITAYFLNATTSTETLAIDAVSGNLCRCTGYAGIKRALKVLNQQFDLTHSTALNRINDLISWNILPLWFADISERLPQLSTTEKRSAFKTIKTATKVAGGTDLWVQQAQQLADQPLEFINSDEHISLSQQRCTISANTRIETLRLSSLMQKLFSHIETDFKLICSMPIRQQATVGGNLVNASPIADLSVFFLALDAMLILKSQQQQRALPLRQFFKDYKQTDLQTEEQLIDIQFFCADSPLKFSFEKVSKRTHLDIASVNSAMSIELLDDQIKTIHISAGGVAATPLYLKKTCHFLQTKTITAEIINKAIVIAQTEISPISDSRGSATYKRLLFKQLLITHFLKLLPDRLQWQDFR